jgi:protein MAK11
MVSVGRGERCMRLWNLVTGKKAGVLNFSRDILQSVKESKYSSGEGRRIRWNPDGSEFAVLFERGAVVFGEDSKPKCKVLPQPLTKLHQICYLPLSDGSGKEVTLLVISTEDGRILFYDTGKGSGTTHPASTSDPVIPEGSLQATVGGKSVGISTRIKDFEILSLPAAAAQNGDLAIATASSDGTIRLFSLAISDLLQAVSSGKPAQLGKMIGSYGTGNRITCMKAFVMQPPHNTEDDLGDDEDSFEGFDGTSDESADDSD